MKMISAAIVATAGLLLSSHSLCANENNTSEASTFGELIVVVNATASDDGVVDVSLLETAEQFSNQQPPLRTCRQPPQQQKAYCHFNDLKHGNYALFIFHDENNNQDLDENFVGAPTEKLAISSIDLSNNDSPTFEQSAFQFDSDKAQVFINLQ